MPVPIAIFNFNNKSLTKIINDLLSMNLIFFKMKVNFV